MRHRIPRIPLRAGLLALAVAAVAACSDQNPVAPSAPGAGRFSVGEEPDTGEVFVDLTTSEDEAVVAEEADAFSAMAAVQKIRIGVAPGVSTVRVGGTGDFQVVNKTTGATLFSGSAEQFNVTLGSGIVTTSSRRLQVSCTTPANRDVLLGKGTAAGFATFTEFFATSNCWRVYIGERPLPANTAAEAAVKAQVRAAIPEVPADAFWRTITISTGVLRYDIARAGGTVSSSGPVVVKPVSGRVVIGTPSSVRQYRGVAEVVRSQAALAGVNELPMEEYLYGVVPRELGPVAFPELEALKAQAVAARTYAISGLGKRSTDGYDLLPTTSDQVYGGFQDEHPLSTQAVDGTAGIVATYVDGAGTTRLITALYSSTTGGHTADNEEAYQAPPASYLRGVPDHERGRALEHVPSLAVFRAHANPASLRAAREGDFESDWSRYHRWTFEWTAAEISQVVSAYAGQPVGRVLAINTPERGPSGRVLRIEYVTEAGTFVDTKDRIRSSLKYINASGTPTSLLSTLFFIEPVIERPSGEVVGFRAYGGGFGHGVGLSQTGAVGMAEKGHSFEQILHHYYRGISLTQWY